MTIYRQRPHFEAAAALGAVGLATATPAEIRRHIQTRQRPAMVADIRYALFTQPDDQDVKPRIFMKVGELARALHRERDAGGLELEDAEIDVRRETGVETVAGVSVWIQDPASGARGRYLGWAYLDGGDRRSLQAALEREVSTRPVIDGRAA